MVAVEEAPDGMARDAESLCRAPLAMAPCMGPYVLLDKSYQLWAR